MIADCPVKAKHEQQERNSNRYEYEVAMFTGNDKEEMVLLLHETWNSAILDSACSSNAWKSMDC